MTPHEPFVMCYGLMYATSYSAVQQCPAALSLHGFDYSFACCGDKLGIRLHPFRREWHGIDEGMWIVTALVQLLGGGEEVGQALVVVVDLPEEEEADQEEQAEHVEE